MISHKWQGAPTHICPGGCGITNVPYARLACRACWNKLPANLRDAVNATYQQRHGGRKARRAHLEAVLAARRWYRDRLLPPMTETTGEHDGR